MTKLNQQARNHREDATKILSVEAQDMDSNHDILLEVPPDGYHTTNNLRWVRSAAQGGTVLVQQYQSPIERGKTVWCVIRHGLPDSDTTPSSPTETTGNTTTCLPQFVEMLDFGVPTETALDWSNGIMLLQEHCKYLVEVIEDQIGDKDVLREAASFAKNALKILKVLQ